MPLCKINKNEKAVFCFFWHKGLVGWCIFFIFLFKFVGKCHSIFWSSYSYLWKCAGTLFVLWRHHSQRRPRELFCLVLFRHAEVGTSCSGDGACLLEEKEQTRQESRLIRLAGAEEERRNCSVPYPASALSEWFRDVMAGGGLRHDNTAIYSHAINYIIIELIVIILTHAHPAAG